MAGLALVLTVLKMAPPPFCLELTHQWNKVSQSSTSEAFAQLKWTFQVLSKVKSIKF